MKWIRRKAKKEYMLLVNTPELLKRAVELGYEDVTLFTEEELDSHVIDRATHRKQSPVRVLYRPDHEEESDSVIYDTIEGTELSDVVIELYGSEEEDGKKILSLEDAVRSFPSVSDLETTLTQFRIINSTDYTDRCGNCQSNLRKTDKYCPYCGTQRGKGQLKPYKNRGYYVYGPPIKKKYQCDACGHVWITAVLAGDHAVYCPQCGRKQIRMTVRKEWDFTLYSKGLEEPYTYEKRPVLFTRDEVLGLLTQRKKRKHKSGKLDDLLPLDIIQAAMRGAGIELPPETGTKAYPRTEKEAEQICLASVILLTEGKVPTGHTGEHCPYCGSDLMAAIESPRHTLSDKQREIQKENETIQKKPALRYRYGPISWDDETQNKNMPPAWICLQCGTKTGPESR